MRCTSLKTSARTLGIQRTFPVTCLASLLLALPAWAQAPATTPATPAPTGPAPAVSAPEPSPAATAAPTAPNPPDDARPDTVREHFAPLINQPGGLTSKEAALAAAKQSPTAAAAQTKVESAQAQIEGVTWRYLPTLTLSASYTH